MAENQTNHSDLITSFTEITSSSIEEATFFLESHNFDLDSAVSTFFETTTTNTTVPTNPNSEQNNANDVNSPPSSSPSRSRSVSPPPSFEAGGGGGRGGVYNLRSRNTGKKEAASGSGRSGRIRTFADLNSDKHCDDCDSGSDEDEPQEYYTGGHKSGQLVQDPSKHNDVDSLFEQARRAGAEDGTLDQHQPSSSSRSFSGRGRLLSGEAPSAAPQQPEPEVHTITFWTNGFSVNDGPLRRLDDPQNASFLESIRNSECPDELKPAKGRAPVQVSLVRKMEEYPIKKQPQAAFVGVGRTLGSTTSVEDTTATIPAPTNAAPTPFVGLVVDDTLPSTSIQLRLGDGTRMVSRFNLHHTVSNIRSFIDASRPGGPRAYQLLTMGFPPKQLNDLNQTIQEAGLANSVVIQKL